MQDWLSILGAVVVAYWALRFLSFLYNYFVASGGALSKIKKQQPDAWAVVTGASDGIGKEYSIQLAKRGFNVCLISRTKSKLDEVASEIESKYKVKTKTIAFDFSLPDPARYTTLANELSALPIGVLVNNVGISFDFPRYFTDLPDADLEAMININIAAATRLTKLVLPKMVARKSGAVVFLGSFSGLIPTAMLSVYGASKAYITHLSRTLNAEYKKHGIVVQAVTPNLVHTAMVKRKSASIDVPTPQRVVSNALRALGNGDRITPYIVHIIIEWLTTSLLPEGFVINKLHGYHISINKRALARQQRESAKKSQ